MQTSDEQRPGARFVQFGWRSDLLSGNLPGVLDHMRWLAALGVTLNHVRNLFFVDADFAGPMSPLVKIFYLLTLFGPQCVVIFFVVSGLLVGGSVLRRLRGDTFSFGDYAIDRGSRLYAVLIPAVILSVGLMMAGLAADCASPTPPIAILGNLLFLQNIVVDPLCNNHPLWSLSNEAFYYVALPVVLLAFRRPLSWMGGLALVLIGVAVAQGLQDDTVRNLPFGALLWTAGIIPWFVRIRGGFLPGLAITAVALLASRLAMIPSEFVAQLLITGGVVLTLCSIPLGSVSGRVGPLVGARLAAFSYSLYLVHMPLAQASFSLFGPERMKPSDPNAFVVFGATVLVIMAVAWLFGRLFESRTADLRAWARTRFVRKTSAPVPHKTKGARPHVELP